MWWEGCLAVVSWIIFLNITQTFLIVKKDIQIILVVIGNNLYNVNYFVLMSPIFVYLVFKDVFTIKINTWVLLSSVNTYLLTSILFI